MIRLRTAFILLLALSGGLLAAYLAARVTQRPASTRPSPRVAAASRPQPTPAPTPPSFAARIPEGMRAMAISVNTVTGVSRELLSGDRVDVIAVGALGGAQKGRIARTVLQSVSVLAAQRPEGDKSAAFQTGSGRWTVTLLVGEGDAQSLSAARDASELTLAVRNPADENDNASGARVYTNARGVETYAPPQAATDVRKGIPKGMRVFTLPISPTDGFGGQLVAGDRVDIIITCPFSKFSADLQVGSQGVVTETRMASSVLMQNIRVLAVDGAGEVERDVPPDPSPLPGSSEGPRQTFEPASDKPAKSGRTAGLLVTPQQAVTLAAARDATSKSVLRLVARHPDDDTRQATRREMLIDLLTERRYIDRQDVDVLRGNAMRRRRFYTEPRIQIPPVRKKRTPDPREGAMVISGRGE